MRRTFAALAGGLATLCLGTALGDATSTYASFSDHDSVGAQAVAGAWTPDPPAACGDVSKYSKVVWGTAGDDVLYGGNHPQVIMGMDGDDVIYGGNSGDCLVGGAGKDRLMGGNAKDILIGGPGDDYLSGGNAKDNLDGSEDLDVCDGGNGKDVIVNCEYDARPRSFVSEPFSTSTTTLAVPGSPEAPTGGTATVEPAPSAPATKPRTEPEPEQQAELPSHQQSEPDPESQSAEPAPAQTGSPTSVESSLPSNGGAED
jgi:Ca2+-binding RTX toxin-like protein